MGATTLRKNSTFKPGTIDKILTNECYVGDRLLQKRAPKNYLTHRPDESQSYDSRFIVDEGFGLRNRMILIHVNSIVVDEDGFILNSQVIESSVVISGLVCKSISDYFRTQEAEVVMDGVFLLRFEASRFE